MNLLCPDAVLDSVCQLTPDWLRARGFQALLLDLDGTLALQDVPFPPADIAGWLESMRAAGFPMIVISNNGYERVNAFCRPFSLTFVPKAHKPGPGVFRAACRRLALPPDAVLAVGDKLHTDVLGAHWAGLRTVLVTTLGSSLIISARRLLEAPFVWRAKKKPRL